MSSVLDDVNQKPSLIPHVRFDVQLHNVDVLSQVARMTRTNMSAVETCAVTRKFNCFLIRQFLRFEELFYSLLRENSGTAPQR